MVPKVILLELIFDDSGPLPGNPENCVSTAQAWLKRMWALPGCSHFSVFFRCFFPNALLRAFFRTFGEFYNFWSQNGPPKATLGPHFFEVFPGLDPLGPQLAPPWAPGASLGTLLDHLGFILLPFGYHFRPFLDAFCEKMRAFRPVFIHTLP